MRIYTIRVFIVFLITYLTLMFVSIFFYTNISNAYLENRASENIMNVNEATTFRVEQMLFLDLNRIQVYIDDLNRDGLDLEENILNNFLIGSNPVLKVGYIKELGLEFDGLLKPYIDFFDPATLNETIHMFALKEVLRDNDDEEVFLVINLDGMLLFVSARNYFEPHFEIEGIVRHRYLIMGKDNQIFFDEDANAPHNKFFDFMRADNVRGVYIEQIISRLYDRESFTVRASIFGNSSYIAFSPLSQSFSNRDLYVVQVFEDSEAFAPFLYLRNVLWAVFAVVLFIMYVALFTIYKLINSKIDDLEAPRLTFYYQKPFILKVDIKGHIKWVNRTFRKHIPAYTKYKTVEDFKVSNVEIEHILDDVKRQRPITAVFEYYEQKIFIHFIILKTFGGYTLIGDNVTQIEGKYDALRTLALIDSLTELPNRNQLLGDLNEHLKDTIESTKKHALVAIEVVSLARIQRLMSEKIVKETLNIIKNVSKSTEKDLDREIYHTDFSTFIVWLKDLESYDLAFKFTESLMASLKDPITIDRGLLEIELKFGIFNIETEKYALLNEHICIDHVKLALEHAKESSSTEAIVYDVNLTLYTSRDEVMEEDLSKAIINQEFMMYFQPQFHHGKQRIVGLEALIRWNHPRYINESPLKFIQLAERNNMIIDIGRIALHETFAQCKSFEIFDVEVSINVSPVQVMQVGFVNELIELARQYEIRKNMICIEITETFLMTSFQQIIDKLKTLQKHGFNVHLDDFGTGYSSLQYLRDLPINSIKIDRAFIDYITTDRYSRAIVNMVSTLAKNVGLEVIAEGVERENQYQLLVKNGFNIFQGYLFSPPLPKIEVMKLLQAYNIDQSKTFGLDFDKRKKK
jgi:EAL domain-containing protein (putative c-di-GMP-specific phosphodiesterase class I)/GGDEF domain-containing protein